MSIRCMCGPFPLMIWQPISPDVEMQDKRIEVDLTMQTLTAFENDKQVLKTPYLFGHPEQSARGRWTFDKDTLRVIIPYSG